MKARVLYDSLEQAGGGSKIKFIVESLKGSALNPKFLLLVGHMLFRESKSQAVDKSTAKIRKRRGKKVKHGTLGDWLYSKNE